MSEFTPITTQEELDAILKARLARQKEQYADYDKIKSRLAVLEEENVALKSTIETSSQSKADYDKQVEALQAQISGYETEALRTKVALSAGLPYDLASRLRGDDEDAMRADAETLAGFLKASEPKAPLKSTEPATIDPKKAGMQAMLEQLTHKGE